MVVKIYISGISGNKEVKKKQQRVQMILDSKSISYEAIDITEPGREKDKEQMQSKAKVREVLGKHPLPPQLFNDEEYCGDYEDFDLANEVDELEAFLHLPIPSKLISPDDETSPAKINGSRDQENNDDGNRNGAQGGKVNGDVELTSINSEGEPSDTPDAASPAKEDEKIADNDATPEENIVNNAPTSTESQETPQTEQSEIEAGENEENEVESVVTGEKTEDDRPDEGEKIDDANNDDEPESAPANDEVHIEEVEPENKKVDECGVEGVTLGGSMPASLLITNSDSLISDILPASADNNNNNNSFSGKECDETTSVDEVSSLPKELKIETTDRGSSCANDKTAETIILIQQKDMAAPPATLLSPSFQKAEGDQNLTQLKTSDAAVSSAEKLEEENVVTENISSTNDNIIASMVSKPEENLVVSPNEIPSTLIQSNCSADALSMTSAMGVERNIFEAEKCHSSAGTDVAPPNEPSASTLDAQVIDNVSKEKHAAPMSSTVMQGVVEANSDSTEKYLVPLNEPVTPLVKETKQLASAEIMACSLSSSIAQVKENATFLPLELGHDNIISEVKTPSYGFAEKDVSPNQPMAGTGKLVDTRNAEKIAPALSALEQENKLILASPPPHEMSLLLSNASPSGESPPKMIIEPLSDFNLISHVNEDNKSHCNLQKETASLPQDFKKEQNVTGKQSREAESLKHSENLSMDSSDHNLLSSSTNVVDTSDSDWDAPRRGEKPLCRRDTLKHIKRPSLPLMRPSSIKEETTKDNDGQRATNIDHQNQPKEFKDVTNAILSEQSISADANAIKISVAAKELGGSKNVPVDSDKGNNKNSSSGSNPPRNTTSGVGGNTGIGRQASGTDQGRKGQQLGAQDSVTSNPSQKVSASSSAPKSSTDNKVGSAAANVKSLTSVPEVSSTANVEREGSPGPSGVKQTENSGGTMNTADKPHEGVSTRDLLKDPFFTPFSVDKVAYSPQLVSKIKSDSEKRDDKGVVLPNWDRRPSEVDLVKQVRYLLDERDTEIVISRARMRAGRSPLRDPHRHFLDEMRNIVYKYRDNEEDVEWPVVPPPRPPTPPPPEPPVDEFMQQVLKALNAPYIPKPKPPPEEPKENIFLNQVKVLLDSEQLTGDGQATFFHKERGPVEDNQFVHKVREMLDEREYTLGIKPSNHPERRDHTEFLSDVLVLLDEAPLEKQEPVQTPLIVVEPEAVKEESVVEVAPPPVVEEPIKKVSPVKEVPKIEDDVPKKREIEIAQIFIRDNIFPVTAHVSSDNFRIYVSALGSKKVELKKADLDALTITVVEDNGYKSDVAKIVVSPAL